MFGKSSLKLVVCLSNRKNIIFLKDFVRNLFESLKGCWLIITLIIVISFFIDKIINITFALSNIM